MKTIKNQIIGTAVVLALSFSSCQKEDMQTPTGTNDNAYIQLTLKLPGNGNGSSTRVIDPAQDENKIETINVLAYIKNGSEWVYDYTATDVSITPASGNNRTVKATVKTMPQDQIFAILANCSSELTAAAPIRGEKMADVEERLICYTGNGEWPANSSATFKPFPMYARTTECLISTETIQPIGTFPMLRMVARIDVTLATNISDFVLEEACLFNRSKAGYISYDKNTTTGSPTVDNLGVSDFKVTSPAVLTSGTYAGLIYTPSINYKAANVYPADSRGEIKCAIYTFEAEAITTEDEKTKKTALVIGGYYNSSNTLSYYRIDLKDRDVITTDYISNGILRNHQYMVEVQSVNSEGYSTAEDAYLGESKLTAYVRPWDLADQKIIVDGQYYLKIESGSIVELYRWKTEVNEATITAETNYNTTLQGLEAGVLFNDITFDPPVTSGSEWLELTSTSNINNTLKRQFKFKINRKKIPKDDYSVAAKVSLKAGNLNHVTYITYINEYYPEPHSGWAGSNIYYNGQNLTFDDENSHVNEQYQGVFFQWGSLYGMSPVGSWSGSTIMYPLGGVQKFASDLYYSTWNTSPRVGDITITSHPPTTKTERDRAYLYELDTDNGDNSGIGDICKYITKKDWAPAGNWRMPTSNEFEKNNDYKISSTWQSNVTIYIHGTALVPDGCTKRDMNDPFFPASGSRMPDGNISNAGLSGLYWSASPSSTNNKGYSIYFSITGVWLDDKTVSSCAFPIRCVKE